MLSVKCRNRKGLHRKYEGCTCLYVLCFEENEYVGQPPHAYLPMLLCDKVPAERAIALDIGLRLLEQSKVLLVCGNRLSSGMKGEISRAVELRMDIIVFDEGLYLDVKKLVTQKGGEKGMVKLDRENFPMGFTSPTTYLENAAKFK